MVKVWAVLGCWVAGLLGGGGKVFDVLEARAKISKENGINTCILKMGDLLKLKSYGNHIHYFGILNVLKVKIPEKSVCF